MALSVSQVALRGTQEALSVTQVALKWHSEGSLTRAAAPDDGGLEAPSKGEVRTVEGKGKPRPVAHAHLCKAHGRRLRPTALYECSVRWLRCGGLLGQLCVTQRALDAHKVVLDLRPHAKTPLKEGGGLHHVGERECRDRRFT